MSNTNKLEYFPRPTEAQMKNCLCFQNELRKFSAIAINNFTYDNLPEPLISRRIERPLFFTGYACFFYEPTLGFMVLPAVVRGELNLYGEPEAWTAQGIGKTFRVDETNSVLIRNDLLGGRGLDLAEYYALKVADVKRTIDNQVFLHKMPFLIKGSDKDILTKKNILKKKDDNELAIFVSNKVNGDDFEVFNTPTPYIIDRLHGYARELEAEYYELLAYNNNPQEKRERLIVDEINANNELTENGYCGSMYEMRQEAVDKINAMYGLNIKVHVNRIRIKTPTFYDDVIEDGENVSRETDEGGSENG